MNLNEARRLAGLPLKEEAEDDDDRLEGAVSKMKSDDEQKAREHHAAHHPEIHVSRKGEPGVLGNVIVIDASEPIGLIAEILGIPDGWKMVKIGKGYASFSSGDRLSFFSHPRDFQPDDDEEDEDDV